MSLLPKIIAEDRSPKLPGIDLCGLVSGSSAWAGRPPRITKVLVVDDDPGMRKVLQNYMETTFDLITTQPNFDTGQDHRDEALQMVREQSFDCIMVDGLYGHGAWLVRKLRRMGYPGWIVAFSNAAEMNREMIWQGADWISPEKSQVDNLTDPSTIVRLVKAADSFRIPADVNLSSSEYLRETAQRRDRPTRIRRVLIVDDNPNATIAISGALEGVARASGFDLLVADPLADLQRFVFHTPVDLLIMDGLGGRGPIWVADLRPRMDGWIAAWSSSSDFQQAMVRNGADFLIDKVCTSLTFSSADLLEKCARWADMLRTPK